MSKSTDKARLLLAGALNIEPAEVGDDASMFSLDAWDSLGHMNIVLGIETALGRSLTAEEIVKIELIEDVENLLVSANQNHSGH